MIHTANLITNRGEYKLYDIEKRKSIFNAIYYFSLEIDVKYKSIFIDKRYKNNKFKLKMKIESEINKFINKNKKFKEINLYYDNGQEKLVKALDETFSKLDGFNHIIEFDHVEEKLFQVADMLTYIDKSYYCNLHKIKNNGNPYFLTLEEYKNIIKNLNKKRI